MKDNTDKQDKTRTVLAGLQGGLLTPQEVARMINTTSRTVTRWLNDGDLKGYLIQDRWRIAPDDLAEFIEKSRNVKDE